MKSNRLYLHLALPLLTLIGACKSFGQVDFQPEITNIDTSKIKIEKPIEVPKDLIIDLNKIDLKNLKVESIKSEIRMGPGSGGGGSSCALMLRQHSVEILEQIKYYQPFQQDGIAEVLAKNIQATQFYMGTDLHINGKKVEAINYPVKKIIVVEQAFCDRLTTVTPASLGLLLHEFLGESGYDDTEFQISSDFVTSLSQGFENNKVGVAGFSSIHMNRMRAMFKAGTVPQGKLGSLGSRCTYFSEWDGRPLSRPLSIFPMSEGSIGISFIDSSTNHLKDRNTVIAHIRSNELNRIVAELPATDPNTVSYLVMREDAKGALIAEWVIIGKSPKETLRLSKSTYPVASLGMRGALVVGYSVCAPKK